VLLITAQGSIDVAVEAMKQGARDFLTKPLTDLPKLKALLDDAERELEMRRKARRLTARIDEDGGLGDFVGVSKTDSRSLSGHRKRRAARRIRDDYG
jgi:DNA-binding NtrC family response regulator